MRDTVSTLEMGTGQYGTAKGIATSDLITTVTPEKKAEEEKAEKEDEEKLMAAEQSEVSEPIPTTPVRHEIKVCPSELKNSLGLSVCVCACVRACVENIFRFCGKCKVQILSCLTFLLLPTEHEQASQSTTYVDYVILCYQFDYFIFHMLHISII